jgi:hypothetical protein
VGIEIELGFISIGIGIQAVRSGFGHEQMIVVVGRQVHEGRREW